MEIIFSFLTILTFIDPGYTGDKELEKIDREVYHPKELPSIVNQTALDVYHATDPLAIGHQTRIMNKMKHTDPKGLRQNAQYWIMKMCEEWPRLTGLKREETNEILNKIYSEARSDGPYEESRIRDKLLEVRPDLRRIHPEYIRSVIHDWYRSRRRGQIRTREDRADLLYTYNRVQVGEGYIHDRLAKKWKQFHPDLCSLAKISLMKKANQISNTDPPYSLEEMKRAEERYKSVFGDELVEDIRRTPSRKGANNIRWIQSRKEGADLLYTYNQVKNGKGTVYDRIAKKWEQLYQNMSNYNKISLGKEAYKLSKMPYVFSPEEMEAAKVRYEKVFGTGDAAPQEKSMWTEEQTADLRYLTTKYNERDLNSQPFARFWQKLHPELGPMKKKTISDKAAEVKRRNIELTPEEKAAAEARLKAAFLRNEQSHQNIVITDKGKSPGTQSSPGRELHQQTSDWMIHSPPHPDDLQLTQEERNDLEMWMNQGTLHHPPTSRYFNLSYHYGGNSPPALSRYPGETSHSNLSPSINDSYTTNPYYEHGSGSHPPDNTHH